MTFATMVDVVRVMAQADAKEMARVEAQRDAEFARTSAEWDAFALFLVKGLIAQLEGSRR